VCSWICWDREEERVLGGKDKGISNLAVGSGEKRILAIGKIG
jgi:hypothetical protein